MSIIARVCLVVALLLGGASIFLSKKVDKQAADLRSNLTDAKTELGNTKKTLATTEGTLKAKQDELTKTEEEKKKVEGQLTEATANVTTLKTQLDETKKMVDAGQAAIKELEGIKAKVAEAEQKQQEVAAQLKAKADEATQLTAQVTALKGENKLLVDTGKQLESRLRFARGEKDWEMPLPEGLIAKVLFYDKSWNFAVLDVGKKKGAVENGVLLLHRGTEVIGQVRISTVDDDASIGDFMGDFKKNPPQAGDTGIPKK
jgi:septal ring factor EnvC (AmiA/AmiB activator)